MTFRIVFKLFLLASIFLFVVSAQAQVPIQADTTQEENSAQQDNIVYDLDSVYAQADVNPELFQEISTLDPDKAALLSAILPGLGQIYNKQYWKLPIILGIGFTLGYYINYNHQYYQSLQNALIAETDNDPTTINRFPNLTESTLNSRTEQFRRDRDYLMIISVVAYLINVADAHISAHLEEFSINDELKLGFRPSLQPMPAVGHASLGMTFSIKF